MNDKKYVVQFLFACFLVLLAIFVFICVPLSISSGTKQNQVGVVVSGGPFDKKRPIQFIKPGQGVSWAGIFNRTHRYPAHQVNRWVGFNSASMQEDKPYYATTKDGFRVGLKGRIYFRFIGEKNPNLSMKFDREYGSRKFEGAHPYDGDNGFSKFLDTMVLPVVKNSLRQEINKINCAELDRSCALIAEHKDEANTELKYIEAKLNKEIAADIQSKLGDNYLLDFRTNILETELSEDVQRQVNQVSVSRSRIKQKQLDVEAAIQEAKAITIRGKALLRNPQIACIEAAKELKDASSAINIIIDASCRGNVSALPSSR